MSAGFPSLAFTFSTETLNAKHHVEPKDSPKDAMSNTWQDMKTTLPLLGKAEFTCPGHASVLARIQGSKEEPGYC